MAKIAMILLSPRSSKSGSHGAGEIVSLDEEEAIALYHKKMAKPKNKKQFEAMLKKKAEQEEARRAEQEKLDASLNQEAHELELEELYNKVIDKEALLAGVNLTDEARAELLDGIKNREPRPGI